MSDLPALTISEHDGVVVVAPVGEFDIAGADLLRSAFTQSLAGSGHRLVVDLAGVTFLDSMALGAIIGAGRRAAEHGGWVRLVAPRPNVRRILRLTEVDRVLGLYDTVEQAVAHETPASPLEQQP